MEVFDIFLLEAVLNGILLGGLLALLSLGLNLIFGVIDVVWICYAEMIMVGMYAVYALHVQQHWPLFAAMAAGIAFVALLGALMHQFVIRPVLTAEPISAQKAYHYGIVNEVVPLPELLPTAIKYAELICKNAPLAVQPATR